MSLDVTTGPTLTASGAVIDDTGRLIVQSAASPALVQPGRRYVATTVLTAAMLVSALLAYGMTSSGWLLLTLILLCLVPLSFAFDVMTSRPRLPGLLKAGTGVPADPQMPPLPGDAEPIDQMPGWFRVVIDDSWRELLDDPQLGQAPLQLMVEWASLHIERQRLIASLDELLSPETPYDGDAACRIEDRIDTISADAGVLCRLIGDHAAAAVS